MTLALHVVTGKVRTVTGVVGSCRNCFVNRFIEQQPAKKLIKYVHNYGRYKKKWFFFSEHRVVIYIAVIVFELIFLLLSNVNSFHTDVAICVNLFIFSLFTALALLVAMVGWQERHSVSTILLHQK